MKTKKRFSIFAVMMLLATSALLLTSCEDEEPEAEKPFVAFDIEVNDLEVTINNNTLYANSYSWDFGDGTGTATEMNPTYTFTDGGTYTITLTATGEGGTTTGSQDVSVQAKKIVMNGGFDDNSVWSIIQHNGNNTGVVAIEEGVAIFNKGIILTDWVDDPHVGINQPIEIEEAGNYQVDLDITVNGISDVWFEVWVGTGVPVDGQDYNSDHGATKALAFNTWDCGDTNTTYSGSMAAASCQDLDGSITLETAGTHYIVIRTGGLNFTDDGIIIDNVSIVRVD